MAVEEAKPKAGLEDVVAATSSICYLDGDRGVLAVLRLRHSRPRERGDVRGGLLPAVARPPARTAPSSGDLQSQLAAARPVPEPILRLMKQLPASDGMDMLRTLTSALGQYDPEVNDASPQAQYRKAVRLTAQMASIVATYGRMQAGGGHIQPDPALGHAANFLYMLTGNRPSALAIRAFDIALVLHADHELNASTFAARVVGRDAHRHLLGDRRRDRRAQGPAARRRQRGRHAAADRDRSGSAARAGRRSDPRASWRRRSRFPASAIASTGPRIPAPRTCARCPRTSASAPATRRWFEMSRRIETLVTGEKKLYPNVDFYSASTYYTLGIPIDLFTPIFAVSRVSGWTAHCLEQYANNRLIRPQDRLHRAVVPAVFPAARSAVTSACRRKLRGLREADSGVFPISTLRSCSSPLRANPNCLSKCR